jgi:hypothetical protein
MNVRDLLKIPPWEWEEEAGSVILETLANQRNEAADRLIAAELAGETVVMNDDMANMLVFIASNPEESADMRATAALGLGPVLEEADMELVDGEFDDPENVPISPERFKGVQISLHRLFDDQATPKEVRRRVLEASVRAPQDWHVEAIKAAHSSGDRDWMMTAIFSMRWVPGFNDQILGALQSEDTEVHIEAVAAAGQRELKAAWPHVAGIITSQNASKALLLAAIEAAGLIDPEEAPEILEPWTKSRDKEIAEAAEQAIEDALNLPPDDILDEDDEKDLIN